MAERHIVIVGGGFTGTALAIHLARKGEAGLTVTVIEPREQLGQGVAYGTSDPAHRINVPASRMQLSAAEEGEFEHWYRHSAAYQADPASRWQDGKLYPQRAQFGAYVAEQFYKAASSGRVKLVHVQDRAVAFCDGDIITATGRRYRADELVLAISHPPPALPRLLLPLADTPALIANPWRPQALASIAAEERVAIIGSGLTMADVVASLARQGHRGPIVAFSRRGQLPRDNISGDYESRELDYRQPPKTLRGWLHRVRQEVAQAAREGQPWQLVLDDIRYNAQQIWQRLPLKEQQRFLRHLRPWWDVHRYRIAPQVSQVLQTGQSSGQLQVLAARLVAAESKGAEIALRLKPRTGTEISLSVDRLIVTTGPAHGSLVTSDKLLSQLAKEGLIQADPLALGILVNAQSRTIDSHGEANPHLHVVGPAARGRFGELMGLPQVAEHAEQLAEQLLLPEKNAKPARCPLSTDLS
ncbi:FAD/NAD(P)-binding protein [Kalamiella sp. sgz302252]|uniref:FAD/NAD(P)-binding protein n=1 Tax=Pantoea sp. sgz302252 TaxID=3341827 RepID=UPI0036D2D699